MPGLDDIVGQPIARTSAPLALLAGYVDLLRNAVGGPAQQRLAVAHVYDLIALALGSMRDDAEIAAGRGLRAARLSAVKANVLANLANQELSVAAVAQRQRITPRYVHMLFEAEGTTFSQFVVGRRLELARRILADPRQNHLTIAAIAYAAGFGDLSYFNRAFRRRYGMTPREARAQGE